VDVLDTTMPLMLRFYVTCLLAVASTFLVIAYTTPIFFAPIAVILAVYYLIQR
jgi:ATP-binding cassette subfamily C (CFTR/MRP) protein 1